MVPVFEEEVIKVVCLYALQVERSECEKDQFYNGTASEWDLQNPGETIVGLGDFNGRVGGRVDGFKDVHVGNGIGKRNVEGRRLPEFCDEK